MVREGEETANRACKIRLFPNEKQKKMMLHNMEVARFAYNWARYTNLQEYEIWNEKKKDILKSLPENISEKDKRKALGSEKKNYISSAFQLSTKLTAEIKGNPEKYMWLGKYDSSARCFSISLSYNNAIKKFNDLFAQNNQRIKQKIAKNKSRGKSKIYKYPRDYGFPQYKDKCEATSYPLQVLVKHLDRESNRVYIPCIGWVKTSKNQPFPEFEFPSKNVANPTISTDGQFFYLSFGYYQPFTSFNNAKTDVIGVDLGVKNIASLSNGKIYSNIADDDKIIKLLAKKVKLQKKLAWVMEHSEVFYNKKQECTESEWKKIAWTIETKQTKTLKHRIRKIENDISNYKKNRLHNICHDIVSKNPEGIVFENLDVKQMQKNKRLSSKLQQTGMYTFKQTLNWHAKKHNIKCKEVSRWFASSQICSKCGGVETNMKNLSKRIFKCSNCGAIIDRDINASINLKKEWNNETVPYI